MKKALVAAALVVGMVGLANAQIVRHPNGPSPHVTAGKTPAVLPATVKHNR